MPNTTVWERFFDAHAPIYDQNVFTKNTTKEVDFLIEELALPPAGRFWMSDAGSGGTPLSWPSGATP